MKKILSLLLCITIIAAVASGCGNADATDPASSEGSSTADISPADISPAETDSVPETESRFAFQPKVSSPFLEEVFGKDMCDAWFNLVDAVMAGEDTFACPDQHTYDWIMGQFRDRCFPLLVDMIDYPYDRSNSVKDGVGQFVDTVPKKEASQKIEEFKQLVEGILNEVLADADSDFEKALALYCYFSRTYEYDYETYELDKIDQTKTGYTSAYRFLTTKTGICREAARAYSYLLMQVGVDASVVMSASNYGEQHEWSIIKLGENYYHIDPTLVMGIYDRLDYFMMDDGRRCNEGNFPKENFTYVSNYSREHPCPDYSANDDAFKALWTSSLKSFDPVAKTLEYQIYDDDLQTHIYQFDYSAY